MVAALLSLTLIATPVANTTPKGDIPSQSGPHTRKAYQKIRDHLKSNTLPSLEGIETLAREITVRLKFTSVITDVISRLKSLRTSRFATYVERTIPGAGWFTAAFDKLTKLSDKVKFIQKQNKTLLTEVNSLIHQTKDFIKRPGLEERRLVLLLTAFKSAKKKLDVAKRSFDDISRYMGTVSSTLERAAAIAKSARDVMLIGKVAKPLYTKLKSITTKIALAQLILKLGARTLEKTKKNNDNIQTILNDGRAHDAYDDAGELAVRGLYGSALMAYYRILAKWPDTTWAHRSDRKAMQEVTRIDGMATQIKGLKNNEQLLRAGLEKTRNELIRITTESKSRLSSMSRRLATLESNRKAWVTWAIGGTCAALLLGIGLILLRRRRQSQGDLENFPEFQSSDI